MNRGVAIAAVLFTALLARFVALDSRPMHADEAILADITATLRQAGKWTYTAADYHGVMLPAVGASIPLEFSEWTLRLGPALAGSALAVFILASTGSPAAGFLVALSPSMVYWSRFYIPEMILALLTALWLTTLRSTNMRMWRYAGLLAGAMLATKETALLAFSAAAAAWWIAKMPRPNTRNLVLMVATATLAAVVVFTSGLQHWDQLALLPAALLSRASGAGHQHPVWWYFSVLRWELLAIPLAVLSWRTDRFLALYALILAALYSAIPYKTPWCAVQFWWPVLALTAGRPKFSYALAGAFGIVTVLTSFIYPASPVNPYVYAQTLPEALQIPHRIKALAPPGTPIQFYSQQNLWPLPWYLRGVPAQQWRRDVDFTAQPAPLVVVTPELESKLIEWLYEHRPPGQRDLYMRVFEQPVYLRPGVEVRLYCAKTLYDAAGATR